MRQEQEFKSLSRNAQLSRGKWEETKSVGLPITSPFYAGREYMDPSGQPQYLISLAPCCLHFYDKEPLQLVSHRSRHCSQASQACPIGNADFWRCQGPLRCLGFNRQPQSGDVRTRSLESLFCYPQSLSQLVTRSIWQAGGNVNKKIFPFPSPCGFSHKLVKL